MARRIGKSARPTGRELGPPDYRLLAEFRRLLARFLAFSERAAKEKGLEPRQHQALLAIKGHPRGAPISVGDLAEWLGIRHHSAVELAGRLAASGYLARTADPKDKRRILLSLTGKGERVLAALSSVHREELRRLSPLLKPLIAQLGARPGA